MTELIPTAELPPERSAVFGPAGAGARAPRRRALLGLVLRTLLFPWGIWCAAAALPRRLRRRTNSRAGLTLVMGLHAGLYLTAGVPLTVLVTGEVLITANEWVIGEQADYGLRSDFAAGLADAPLDVPGPPSLTPALPPESADDAARRRALVERYAPVIVQKLAHHPEWDLPVAIDYDGNWDPRDNVRNMEAHRPPRPVVYGELTAETEDPTTSSTRSTASRTTTTPSASSSRTEPTTTATTKA